MQMKKALLLIIGLFLIADSIWLLSFGKIHFGIALPLLIGSIFILLALFWRPIQHAIQTHRWLRYSWRAAWGIFGLWLLSLAAFFGYMQLQTAQLQDAPQVKAIMVLGGGINKDQPTPAVKQRLDTAAEAAAHYPHAPLIMTGGVGFNDTLSEAQVMAQYLINTHQIDAQRIYQEAKSTSTEENFRNCKALLLQLHIPLDQPIAVVTNDFHLARALAIGKRQGYQHLYGISAPTPLYMRYNNWLREYFAYGSGWLLNEY